MKIYFLMVLIWVSVFLTGAMEPGFKKLIDSRIKRTVNIITSDQLKDYYDQNKFFYLLDTRSREEYNVSRLKGAVLIDEKNFHINQISYIPRDALVLLYCSVGLRSEKMGEKMIKAGYKNIFNLYGGIFEWINSGYPLYQNDKQTDRVHGYSKSWSQWIKQGEIILNPSSSIRRQD